MNICVIVPSIGAYSETFVRAHIERLPGKTSVLYGGYFPLFKMGEQPLLPAPSLFEKTRRSFLSRVFKMDYSNETLRHKALVQYFKENHIHAVLAEYGPTAVEVSNACQEAGVALIAHFHGFDAYEGENLKKYRTKYLKLFETADAIIAVSRHMQEHLIAMGAPKDKVHYNPCGMDATIFYGSDPAKAPPVFLSTGRFVDKKGPHLTLLAFSNVLAHIPEAKLIMVGDGPLHDICTSLVKAWGIEKSVEFRGPQTHTQVADLMRQVRAFVQHSRVPVSGDSEGTPVAVSEAGGAGLPVVATRHGGIPDVVEDGVTGFLVEENDTAAMAERMLRLARDPQLASQLGKAARARVLERFTLEQTIKKLSDVITAAVAKKSGKTG